MSAFFRTLFAGAALTLAAGAASAQDCPVEPVFVGVSGSSSDVRAAASRIDRGEWDIAEHFSNEALESGTSSRNKAAAYINLCAALASQRSPQTSDACAEAITRNAGSWEAYTNRGAAFWLAGDTESAAEDFQRAAELGGGELAVTTNLALAACAD